MLISIADARGDVCLLEAPSAGVGHLETFGSDARLSRNRSRAGVRDAPPERVVWSNFHSSTR